MRSPLLCGAKDQRDVTMSLRSSLDLIANPENLTESVVEVFQLMVGVGCRPAPKPDDPEIDSVTAVVGLGGLLTGACVLHCSGNAARAMAANMTGMDFAAIDDTVKDAVGEVCNMVAGTWKSKVPGLASRCNLSVPAIIDGRNYRLRVQAPGFTVQQSYRFNDAIFDVTILCDGLQ
jgi:chemotaxis protein CheX